MDTFDLVRPEPDGLLHRPGLLAAGLTPGEVDRLVRAGLLRPVRRGVYRPGNAERLRAGPAHLLRARATSSQVADGTAFGHATAAIALDLPVWGVPLDRLHLVRERTGGGGRVRRGTHVHRVALPAEDVIECRRLLVTSAARTAADLARTVPAESALVTMDAAMHETVRRLPRGSERGPGATTGSRIAAVLDRFAGRRGVPAAHRVLAFADECSESPGETRSRFHMHLAGLPAPITQWEVPGLPFRTDFAWPEHGVIGEFDGRVKYGRALRHPVTPRGAPRIGCRTT